ncbi:MAG: 3-deoxy-manno-octulosonate cytidylyltransferase, partial [Calditrichaeota bacterium]|nr:3-deoxy-manno-octulosonate cytidylyltransferase [Calditrichota bacterium]
KKWARDVPMLKQVCVMPFRRDFLLSYANLAPTPLEIFESVDMLRIIEHGFKVRMVMTDSTSYSVDNQSDLALVERAMMSDTLRLEYQTQAN